MQGTDRTFQGVHTSWHAERDRAEREAHAALTEPEGPGGSYPQPPIQFGGVQLPELLTVPGVDVANEAVTRGFNRSMAIQLRALADIIDPQPPKPFAAYDAVLAVDIVNRVGSRVATDVIRHTLSGAATGPILIEVPWAFSPPHRVQIRIERSK